MKIFEKLRIIEAGETANYYEEGGKAYKLVISASAFPSLVALGNSRPIHARRTHNGTDLLDGYIGHFANFTHDENAVYADLVMSEALESAYPSEYNFMVAMIEKEPELLGVSVNQSDVKQLDEEAQTATVTEVRELFSADLVGLPAATSSLFNNNLNKLSMSTFWTKLAELVKSTKLARETVTTKEGKELVIIAQGEQAALGDEVQDAEGKPVEDGDYYISIGEGEDMIISVVAGKISSVAFTPFLLLSTNTALAPSVSVIVAIPFATLFEAISAKLIRSISATPVAPPSQSTKIALFNLFKHPIF